MADSTIANLTDGATADATDRIPVERSPFGAGTNRYITPAYIKTFVGAGALSGITAAAAANTIASGNNHSQIWNWALTSNSVTAMQFGETTAATGGTSTSGVPNQVIAKFSTLAASTASPLSVYSRGTHVFSVSPTAAQLLAGPGTLSNPAYGFAAVPNTGMYMASSTLVFAVSGSQVIQATTSQLTIPAGTASAPAVRDSSTANSGYFWPGGSGFGIVVVASENARFDQDGSSNQFLRLSNAQATTTAYELAFRKARGTVASPTVVTTGDDLATISGSAYVGATGTYVRAASIVIDSTGTIANNSTGVGGIIRLSTRKVAGSVTERLRVDENETADETSVLISVNGAAAVRVSQGATDSGGSGYRVLRIPN